MARSLGLSFLFFNFIDFLIKVYRKVWAGDGGDGDVMRIIYRMRGLLGDATEEFIENLDPKKEEEVNNEQVYRMANVMAECGGIDVSQKCWIGCHGHLDFKKKLNMIKKYSF